MRWFLGFVIVLPIPLVAFLFVAGGADGHRSSMIKMMLTLGPILVCSVFALYRLVTAQRLGTLDWIAIGIALMPYAFGAWIVVRGIMGRG